VNDRKKQNECHSISNLSTMMNILACLILDEDTGRPLYTHFIDRDLKKNPSVIPQKLRSEEFIMIHEMGIQLNLVFSLLVHCDEPELHVLLKKFRDRVETTYPEGMNEGTGNFADYVILEEIVRSIFIDREI
jgi:hypothetical protein